MSLRAKEKKKNLLLSDPIWEVYVPLSYHVSSFSFNLKWSSWVLEEYRSFIF